MRTLPVALATLFAFTVAAASAAPSRREEKQEAKREETRKRIDGMAAASLGQVLKDSPGAQALYDKAVGWAAFDTTKFALGHSGGGGHGVAVNKATDARTYMRVGTVGVGLGLGGANYQLIFLFETEEAFRKFVDNGWQADASASAVAGNEGATAETQFRNGMAFWQISDKGLMARADIAGTKYWKADKLND